MAIERAVVEPLSLTTVYFDLSKLFNQSNVATQQLRMSPNDGSAQELDEIQQIARPGVEEAVPHLRVGPLHPPAIADDVDNSPLVDVDHLFDLDAVASNVSQYSRIASCAASNPRTLTRSGQSSVLSNS